MIRHLIIVLFASFLICMAENQADKLGTIIDKICAKRLASNAPLSRLDSEKTDKDDDNIDDDIENLEDSESKSSDATKTNRRTIYGMNKRISEDDSSESSEENSNINSNTNINTNIKRRSKPMFYARRFAIKDPNREMHRRMNGIRRKLSKY